jgi:hypothetical protein
MEKMILIIHPKAAGHKNEIKHILLQNGFKISRVPEKLTRKYKLV